MCWVQSQLEMDEAALVALGSWQPSEESVEAVRAIVRDANLSGPVSQAERWTASCGGLCVERPPDVRAECPAEGCGLERQE